MGYARVRDPKWSRLEAQVVSNAAILRSVSYAVRTIHLDLSKHIIILINSMGNMGMIQTSFMELYNTGIRN